MENPFHNPKPWPPTLHSTAKAVFIIIMIEKGMEKFVKWNESKHVIDKKNGKSHIFLLY